MAEEEKIIRVVEKKRTIIERSKEAKGKGRVLEKAGIKKKTGLVT